MGSIGREQLWEQIKLGRLEPVYVLFGPETYLRDLAAKSIADACFGEGDLRDFNESEFSLSADDGLQRAFAASNQLPMMAARRVIRVTDVRVTSGGRLDTMKEEHEPILSEYFERPSPASVIVFVADELNGVRKIGKLLRSAAVAVEFVAFDPSGACKWARQKFAQNGAEIDEVTLRHFVARCGYDAARIATESEKVATAVLPGNSISAGVIDSLVPNSHELTNFEITDALIRNDKRRSLLVLRKVLEDGAEPLMILGLISYNFRRLLMAKDMMLRGSDRSDVIRAVNLRGRDQEAFLGSARRADAARLARAIARIAETDLSIKSSIGGGGPAGGRLQLEVLVAELASI